MNLEKIKHRNLKLFWIIKIDEWIINEEHVDKMKDEDWKRILWDKDSVNDIEEYSAKLYNKVWKSNSYSVNFLPLTNKEKQEYPKIKDKDIKEAKMLTKLEDEKNKLQTLVDNYEADIKSIIGSNEVRDWNKKVIKADIKDQDILNLQKKVADLSKEKGQLDKILKAKENELATKQTQILNHRCETPNQQELNQIKAELTKISAERDLLKVQLGQKGPDLPLPEENENNDDLTLEELKNKLKQRQIEVRNLQNQLKEKEQQLNSKPTSKHSTLSLILFGSSVLLFSGSLVSFWLINKKKKKKTIILPVFPGNSQYHFSVRPQALAI
ncbi:MAG: hypothetical protein I3273_06075 [Candidatus Moeniiplasma glomeromycotorum]|nr:hypothetical protein [Candidatus Moeniiplasma glomeromycotorum]MCE8169652.1 hypothetical protein [Candidatus Moeniiplasma glomeromycotorum]